MGGEDCSGEGLEVREEGAEKSISTRAGDSESLGLIGASVKVPGSSCLKLALAEGSVVVSSAAICARHAALVVSSGSEIVRYWRRFGGLGGTAALL